MPVVLSGTNGVTFPDSSLQAAAASPYVLKNRIINGDFRISQYNGSSSTTPTSSAFVIDRWRLIVSASSKLSVQQNAGSVTPPAGFTNYLGLTSLATTTVASGDEYVLYQKIEGFNTADLAWGTANAKSVTLSFQVYSSLTGTFGGAINNSDQSRSYPFSYSIPVANTWTSISVTVAGDTTGTWLTTNNTGIIVRFGLGVGSTYSGTAGSWSGNAYDSTTGAVSVVGTNGATFYITGVQLEIGTSATPFERRLYNQELANCQRYYFKVGLVTDSALATGLSPSSNTARVYMPFPVTMRTAPTLSQNALWATDAANYNAVVSSIGTVNVNNNSARILFNTDAVMTGYRPVLIVPSSTSGYIDGTSEL